MRTPRHHYPDPYHYRPRRTRLILPLLIGLVVLAIALANQPATTTGPVTAAATPQADTTPATTGQPPAAPSGQATATGGRCQTGDGGQP